MGGEKKIKRTIYIDVEYLLAPRFSTVILLLKKLIYRSICSFSPTLQPRPEESVESLLGCHGQRGARRAWKQQPESDSGRLSPLPNEAAAKTSHLERRTKVCVERDHTATFQKARITYKFNP